MPRPYKENAEYFSHDSDASGDEKILYLESKYGLTGYSFFFKMLEILAHSKNFEIELNEVSSAIYAKKIGVSMQEFSAIIKDCIRPEIRAFSLVNGKLYSEGLKKRLKNLVDKRHRQRNSFIENDNSKNASVKADPSASSEEISGVKNKSRRSPVNTEDAPPGVIDSNNPVLEGDNGVNGDYKPLKTGIVKESKVKKSKKKKKDDHHDDHDIPISSIDKHLPENAVSKLFSIWSRVPDSPAEAKAAEELLKTFSFNEVEEAFYRSAEYRKATIPYVRAILDNSQKEKKEKKNETTDKQQRQSKQSGGESLSGSAFNRREAAKDFSSVIIRSAGTSGEV